MPRLRLRGWDTPFRARLRATIPYLPFLPARFLPEQQPAVTQFARLSPTGTADYATSGAPRPLFVYRVTLRAQCDFDHDSHSTSGSVPGGRSCCALHGVSDHAIPFVDGFLQTEGHAALRSLHRARVPGRPCGGSGG